MGNRRETGAATLVAEKKNHINATKVASPNGYKQTKVGVIPEEWEVVKLGEISDFITKGATPTTYGFEWQESGIPFLRSECVSDNGLNLKAAMFISEEANKHMNRSEIRVGDLLMTITGNVGRVVLLKEPFIAGNINQHIARIRIVSKDANIQFVNYFMSQNKYRLNYYKITTGQAYPQISLKQVRDSIIPLPPLKEQQKIAQILTTWDKAISKQEALIAEKEQLKKGLMQKLLSGEVRFGADHTGAATSVAEDNATEVASPEWEEVRLGDVLSIGSGKDYKHLNQGDIPVYGTGGKMLTVDDFLYDGESVCIGRKGTIDKPQFLTGKFWTVDTLFYTHSFNNTIPKFIYFVFSIINWKKYNEASGVPSLSKTTIESITIKLPPFKEQQKIAQVLATADREIELLKNELEALKEQKRGLMQRLLTGKVRVVA